MDLGKSRENPLPVALKLMHNKEEYEREIKMRKLENGSELDGSHVLQLLDTIDLGDKSLEQVAAAGVKISDVDLKPFKDAVKPVYAKLNLEKEAAIVDKVLGR